MDDLISRAVAQTELQLSARRYTVAHEAHGEGRVVWSEDLISVSDAMNVLRKLPSAQPYTINPDGRLWITVDDIDKVTAVVVDEHKSKFCKQFYEDAQPEIIRCKDCKHWIPYDWMFSEVWQSQNIDDYPEDEIGCDCCDMAMKANDFCSRVERRTE